MEKNTEMKNVVVNNKEENIMETLKEFFVTAYQLAYILKAHREDGYSRLEWLEDQPQYSVLFQVLKNLGHVWWDDDYDCWMVGTPTTKTLTRIIEEVYGHKFWVLLDKEDVEALNYLRGKSNRWRTIGKAIHEFGRGHAYTETFGCLDFEGINMEELKMDVYYGPSPKQGVRSINGTVIRTKFTNVKTGEEVERPAETLCLGPCWH